MTQKTNGKPNGNSSIKVIVFGVDGDCKPHAAWFPKDQADTARAAAKQLRFNVIEVTNGTAADLVAKLPPGRIHANGPGDRARQSGKTCTRKSWPPSIQEVKPAENPASRSPLTCQHHGTRSSPATSSLRPRQFGRRLVGGNCRWPDRRQAHASLARLPRLAKGQRARLSRCSGEFGRILNLEHSLCLGLHTSSPRRSSLHLEETMASQTDRIRTLNDEFRQKISSNFAVITPGVAALGKIAVDRIVKTIAVYDDFCQANDPHHEHDFGSFDAEGQTIFFKIDYYDRALTFHSPDPANPSVTQRVMTIMLAHEY